MPKQNPTDAHSKLNHTDVICVPCGNTPNPSATRIHLVQKASKAIQGNENAQPMTPPNIQTRGLSQSCSLTPRALATSCIVTSPSCSPFVASGLNVQARHCIAAHGVQAERKHAQATTLIAISVETKRQEAKSTLLPSPKSHAYIHKKSTQISQATTKQGT